MAVLILVVLAVPVSALDLTAPSAPKEAADLMPGPEENFGAGVWYIVKKAAGKLSPDLRDAARICLAAGCCGLLLSVFSFLPGGSGSTVDLVGTAAISLLLLSGTGSMITLAEDTVRQLCAYAKLFFPVLSTALAAQGQVGGSAALYGGTMVCTSLLSGIISGILIPLVYVYLVLGIGWSVSSQQILQKLMDSIRSVISWGLKMILYGFMGYMTLTGAIAGAADATALKVAKMTISSVVPVIGGILSNASEAVVLSAATVKNAAGVYGFFAFTAMWISPFLKIGIRYFLLKGTVAICSVFGCKKAGPVDCLCSAMGLLLAMTGTVCVMLIVSIACFMKGVG